VIPVVELIAIATMTSEWTVTQSSGPGTTVPSARQRQRHCRTVTLAESNFDAVQRHDLHHNCGGRVTPIAPLNAM